MDVIGINSDGDTTIYGYLNLEGGTNINHNNFNSIDVGAYHLTASEYAQVQTLNNYTIKTVDINGAI